MLVPPGAVERPTGCIQRFFDEGGALRPLRRVVGTGVTSHAVARPSRFEEHRWLGDKRSMRVHDLDAVTDACAIDDLLASERFMSFGPDALPEARNRGYRPCPHCVPDGG